MMWFIVFMILLFDTNTKLKITIFIAACIAQIFISRYDYLTRKMQIESINESTEIVNKATEAIIERSKNDYNR